MGISMNKEIMRAMEWLDNPKAFAEEELESMVNEAYVVYRSVRALFCDTKAERASFYAAPAVCAAYNASACHASRRVDQYFELSVEDKQTYLYAIELKQAKEKIKELEDKIDDDKYQYLADSEREDC